MTNPRASILIKPGDESQVYTLGQPRIFKWGPNHDVDPADWPEPEPTRETQGWDVSDWLAVTVLHYCGLDDTNGDGVALTIKPWRYYAATNPIVLADGFTGNLQNVPATGRWVADNDRTPIYLRGTAVTGPMHFSVPTLNCDRIFFQIKAYDANEHAHYVEYLAQQVYGTTPRSDDGTYPGIVGGETLELETELLLLHADLVAILAELVAIHVDIGPTNIVYNSSAAVAMNVATAEAAPFELVEVTCHLSAAPVTSEQFRILLDANDGAAYDTELFAVDPATYMGGVVDIVYKPPYRMLFENGDQIRVTWTNTDLRTYGLRIVVKR